MMPDGRFGARGHRRLFHTHVDDAKRAMAIRLAFFSVWGAERVDDVAIFARSSRYERIVPHTRGAKHVG